MRRWPSGWRWRRGCPRPWGGLDVADVAVHDELIAALGAPSRVPEGVTVPDVMAVVRVDNKRGYLDLGPDEVAMVLLRRIGVPLGPVDRPLVAIPLALVRDVVTELDRRAPVSVQAACP